MLHLLAEGRVLFTCLQPNRGATNALHVIVGKVRFTRLQCNLVASELFFLCARVTVRFTRLIVVTFFICCKRRYVSRTKYFFSEM